MKMIDLQAQQVRIRDRVEHRIAAVLDHGQYIMGPEVAELEDKLAGFVGSKHCITVASGSDALLIALMSLGIEPGDEIVTTSFTFAATGGMICLLGAVPRFVDINPLTFNLDANRLDAAVNDRTRAIMPVSLYGQCSDMDAIEAVASANGLPVIEDGAQSFGATYKGRYSCALSTIGVTSFFPSKPLGCYGDGGACFTDDDEIAERIRQIRVHGQDRRYHHVRVGINGRLDTIQAAILLAKLEIFSDEITRREEVGKLYTRLLKDVSPAITTPHVAKENTSVYAQYTIRLPDRDAVQDALKSAGIPTAIHYPLPLPQQPAFADFCTGKDSFTKAESASLQVLSLPMHPYLESSEQERVVESIRDAIRA